MSGGRTVRASALGHGPVREACRQTRGVPLPLPGPVGFLPMRRGPYPFHTSESER